MFGRTSTSIIVLLLLALPIPAVAQKPTIEIAPFTGVFVPAGTGCAFDVLVVPQEGRPNKGRQITFTNNTALLVGVAFVTARNLSTGKSIDLTLGPVQFTFSTTTTSVVFLGQQLLLLPPSTAATANLPLLSRTQGRVALTIDDQGNITVDSVSGSVQDLCPALE